ncbi:MAG: phosphodiester glycosidase family protein [Chitinophagales bacterium]
MKTKGLGNIWGLVVFGSFIVALFAVDVMTNNGNFSFFQFPNLNGNKNSGLDSNGEADTDIRTDVLVKRLYKPQKEIFKGASYDVAVVNLNLADIAFFWKNEGGEKIHTFHDLDLQLQQEHKKLLFATNGGMFTPAHEPVGLYIEESKLLQKNNLEKDKKGNFFLHPNGIFYLTKDSTANIVPSTDFNDSLKQITKYATQSGPMLLIDGEIHPKFGKESKNTNIRSGVGIIDAQTLVFAISNEEVNFYDFASFFQQKFGCENALYLDGVISEMYLPELGRYDSVGKFGVMIGVFEGMGEI